MGTGPGFSCHLPAGPRLSPKFIPGHLEPWLSSPAAPVSLVPVCRLNYSDPCLNPAPETRQDRHVTDPSRSLSPLLHLQPVECPRPLPPLRNSCHCRLFCRTTVLASFPISLPYSFAVSSAAATFWFPSLSCWSSSGSALDSPRRPVPGRLPPLTTLRLAFVTVRVLLGAGAWFQTRRQPTQPAAGAGRRMP